MEERNIPVQRPHNKEQEEKQFAGSYTKSRSDSKQKLKFAISKPHLVSQQIHVKLGNVIEERRRLEMQLSETKLELQEVEKLHEEQEKLKTTQAKLQDDVKQTEEKLGRAMEEKRKLKKNLKKLTPNRSQI
ncbi:uncharacterized protein [Ptychodera flava]|uniref:uncharacterized protein n=1 Tax=Ptychodera flava TaxID=63121 RepID=UPI00396A68C8